MTWSVVTRRTSMPSSVRTVTVVFACSASFRARPSSVSHVFEASGGRRTSVTSGTCSPLGRTYSAPSPLSASVRPFSETPVMLSIVPETLSRSTFPCTRSRISCVPPNESAATASAGTRAKSSGS